MNFKKLDPLGLSALILVLIGALNWGLIGIIKKDIVAFLLGSMTPASRIVYTLVGLSGLYILYIAIRQRK